MSFFRQWLLSNWQTLSWWCTGTYTAIKIAKGFSDIVLKVSAAISRFETAESTITSMATNHLPHIQLELERVNKTMSSMDETLKKMYERQYEDHDIA